MLGDVGGLARWTYEERRAVSILRRDVACTYTHTIASAYGPSEHRILAHGAVGILWAPESPLMVTGPNTAPRTLVMEAGSTVSGVRFRTGHASALLGVPVPEVVDGCIPLAELWGPSAYHLADQMHATGSESGALLVMMNALAARLAEADEPDGIVGAAVDRLRRSRLAAISDLSESLGVSERQLRRRFVAGIGLGPKTFHGIVRMRRFLALAGRRPAGSPVLDRLAVEAGYADQSHLTREFSRFAGMSPAAHLRDDRSWA